MKKYIKTIDGKKVIKSANEIVVRKNGMQTFNPTEAQILADGWEEYIEPEYMPTLEDVKGKKYAEIVAYDSSSEVNEFSIGGVPMWLDKATRAGLKLKFEAEEALAQDDNMTNPTTSLWYGVNEYILPLSEAKKLLLRLEIYASLCYNNTQRHLAEVSKLDTIEAVNAYDYTIGYPNKLAF